MTRKGILFVISGPSGVGKGTIKDELFKVMTDIELSISATTRLPREGEVNGKEYYFLSKMQFQEMVNRNELLEWAQVYNNFYGTPRSYVEEKLNSGQDIFLEIDIQGALQVKAKYPNGVYIFLSPPNIEELVARLSGRGKDSKESIEIRLASCREEMEHIKYYDYEVVNDDLEVALKKVISIIIAERCRIK